MNIDKKKDSYDEYTMKVSYVELRSIEKALSAASESDLTMEPDPIRDSLLMGIRWYTERLPVPGEEMEDPKDKNEGSEGTKGEELPSSDEEPAPLPEPDTDGGAAPDLGGDDELPDPGAEPAPEPRGVGTRESVEDELPDPNAVEEKLKPLKASKRSPVRLKKTGYGAEVAVSYKHLKGDEKEDATYYGDATDEYGRKDVRNTAARMIRYKRALDRKKNPEAKTEAGPTS